MKPIFSPVKILYSRRELINELVRRELRDRHVGQVLGVLWAYGHPLVLMLIYTFLFAYVFPARFGSAGKMQDYSVNVFAGIVPWLAFQDLLARAPSILVGNANLVKQIVFPMEVQPLLAPCLTLLVYFLRLFMPHCMALYPGLLFVCRYLFSVNYLP